MRPKRGGSLLWQRASRALMLYCRRNTPFELEFLPFIIITCMVFGRGRRELFSSSADATSSSNGRFVLYLLLIFAVLLHFLHVICAASPVPHQPLGADYRSLRPEKNKVSSSPAQLPLQSERICKATHKPPAAPSL